MNKDFEKAMYVPNGKYGEDFEFLNDYFEHEDFICIFDFNTPDVAAALLAQFLCGY